MQQLDLKNVAAQPDGQPDRGWPNATPTYYPSDSLNVPVGRPHANSRFLTDCYHVLAALLPP